MGSWKEVVWIMDSKKILNKIKTLRIHLDKLQSEAESINNALAVLEKELSDSGVSGSSARKGSRKAFLKNEAMKIAARNKELQIKKAAQRGS